MIRARFPRSGAGDTDVTIRPAMIDDAGLLADVERRADERYLATTAAVLARGDGIPRAVVCRYVADDRLLVAEFDGEIVGFVAWAPERAEAVCGVSQISVLPVFGGRGIGTLLMRAALEAARHRGFEVVVLATQSEVSWNAPWFRRLGFETIPKVRWEAWMQVEVAVQERDGIPWTGREWMRVDL